MILPHRGNPVDEERQGYWYLSSREKCICMLDGVTKPILEENNYAIIIGKLKQLSLFDNLPINYRHSYNKNSIFFVLGFTKKSTFQQCIHYLLYIIGRTSFGQSASKKQTPILSPTAKTSFVVNTYQ